jgi:hypothetical protein
VYCSRHGHDIHEEAIVRRKSNRTDVSQPQLALPFAQDEAARDLSYYVGLCKVFAAYHKRWPTEASTREEFRAARISHYDGQRINRELRYPGPALEADPAYRELEERCRAEGLVNGVDLDALDPRYRTVLDERDIAQLFATMMLPGRTGPGAVRYATGVAAHGPGELTLRLGEAVRARALEGAGFDPNDVRVLAHGYSVRVRATDELRAIIDRIGVRHPSAHERLADLYLLDAGDEGRLYIKYQLLTARRYAGRFDVDGLVRKLASVYAADPDLAGLRAADSSDGQAPPAIRAAPARHADDELREQLAMLEPEGRSLKLPIQQLSRFADIRRALEKMGGIYRANAQRFDFEDDDDPASVVDRLINGGDA